MEQILLNNGIRGDIRQHFINILTKSVEQTPTPELIGFENNMKDALGEYDTRDKKKFYMMHFMNEMTGTDTYNLKNQQNHQQVHMQHHQQNQQHMHTLVPQQNQQYMQQEKN